MRARASILSVISLSISLVSVALSYFKRFPEKEKISESVRVFERNLAPLDLAGR